MKVFLLLIVCVFLWLPEQALAFIRVKNTDVVDHTVVFHWAGEPQTIILKPDAFYTASGPGVEISVVGGTSERATPGDEYIIRKGGFLQINRRDRGGDRGN